VSLFGHDRGHELGPDDVLDAELLSKLDGDDPGLKCRNHAHGETSLKNPVRVGNFPIAKT
jgi:hypothetical protein